MSPGIATTKCGCSSSGLSFLSQMNPSLQRPLRLRLSHVRSGEDVLVAQLASAGIRQFPATTRLKSAWRRGSRQRIFSINGVAAWMGWPDSPHDAERESQYLSDEIACLEGVLMIWRALPRKSTGADTTEVSFTQADQSSVRCGS